MLVAHAKIGSRDVFILGLVPENITRLQAGKPVRVTHESHYAVPVDISFVIFTGADDKAMAEELVRNGIVDKAEEIRSTEPVTLGIQPSPRTYSRGRISADDDGDLEIKISRDEDKNVVVIDFASPVRWLGMSKDDATAVANLLLKHAAALP